MKLVGSNADVAISAATDIFGRDAFGAGLLHLFSSSQNSLVILLDEKWGAGKTVFAKRFIRKAEDAGHAAIYFDAFKRDYDPDVFVSLTSELLAKFPKDSFQEKTIKQKAVAVGRVLGRVGLKVAVRAVTGGLARAADFDEAKEEAASESNVDVAAVVDAELDKLIDARLSGARAADAAFDGFREALQQLGQAGGDNAQPLIFIVDELDRCRPDYALDVLETIKHFFSVPGVHFLLVCDFSQLTASVEARYGVNSSSEVYLEKFLDARISFPIQNPNERERSYQEFIRNNIEGMPVDGEDGRHWQTMVQFLSNVAIQHNYSLRRVEKIITQFSLCMAFTKLSRFRHHAIVCFLCDLKISNKRLFDKAKAGKLEYSEIKKVYDLSDDRLQWFQEWFRYFYDSSIDRNEPRWTELKNSLVREHSGNYKQMGIYLANQIVDRLTV